MKLELYFLKVWFWREYERTKENLEGEAKRGWKTSYNYPK